MSEYNSHMEIAWHGIPMIAYFNWHEPEPYHNYAGGVDEIVILAPLDKDGEEFPVNLVYKITPEEVDKIAADIESRIERRRVA